MGSWELPDITNSFKKAGNKRNFKHLSVHQRQGTELVFDLLHSGDLSALDSDWNRTDLDLLQVGHFYAINIGSMKVLGEPKLQLHGEWEVEVCLN